MNELDKLLSMMEKDGGKWREVRFWTKESTNGIFEKGLSKFDGLANVSILDNGTDLVLRINPQSVDPLSLKDNS
jgi:hypothetical protein